MYFLENRRVGLDQYNIWTKFRRKLSMLNLFNSESTQIHTIWRERLSTRLYLLFLLICILNVIIYTVVSIETTTETVATPSQAQHKELLLSHSNALHCPCTYTSVKHKQFITVNTILHQVCSSDFVKDPWLDYLFDNSVWSYYDRSDIRVRGVAYFGLLSELCTLSQKTIDIAVDQFLTDAFVSAQAMSESEFQSTVDVITGQFKTTTMARFSRDLQLLRSVTHGNTFISHYYLNWHWWMKLNGSFPTIPTSAVTLRNGCSCGTRSDCTESGGIYHFLNKSQHFAIPGWNVGCSSVETVLRSTLECFYNQTCIDQLQYYAMIIGVGFRMSVNVTAINFTLSSRFQNTTAIQDIVDALFVEQWHIDVSYAAFYNQCAPIECSYTFQKGNNFLYIVSRILGLYGGLTISLQFIVPYIITLALIIRGRCFINRVVPLA